MFFLNKHHSLYDENNSIKSIHSFELGIWIMHIYRCKRNIEFINCNNVHHEHKYRYILQEYIYGV